jgi:hypothetical protein
MPSGIATTGTQIHFIIRGRFLTKNDSARVAWRELWPGSMASDDTVRGASAVVHHVRDHAVVTTEGWARPSAATIGRTTKTTKYAKHFAAVRVPLGGQDGKTAIHRFGRFSQILTVANSICENL